MQPNLALCGSMAVWGSFAASGSGQFVGIDRILKS